MNPTPLRRLGASMSTLALCVFLAGCGGSGASRDDNAGAGSPGGTGASAPSDDELATALLTSDDVPEGYTEDVPEESTDSTVFDGTCLTDVADFKAQVGSDPVSEAKTEFTTEDAGSQAQIAAGTAYYADEDAVTKAFGAFYDSVSGCTDLTFSDEDDISYDIAVAIDDTVTVDGADQQLTITLDGSVTAGDQQLPVAFRFLITQNGAGTSSVGTSEIGTGFAINDQVKTYAQTQADRLAGVLG